MAVAITQTANPAGVATSSGVATYSGVSIGTESPDRVIVVTIGKEEATGFTPSSVTIDGQLMRFQNGTTFGNMGAWIYWRPWPTGTTADIAVDWGGVVAGTANHIAVYAVTDAAFPCGSGTNTSTDMDATAPLTTGSLTIPTNGGLLAVAVGAADGTQKTWANAGEDIDADAGDFRFTTAISTSPGTVTVTCTGGTNNEDGVLVWLLMRQQEIPLMALGPPRA